MKQPSPLSIQKRVLSRCIPGWLCELWNVHYVRCFSGFVPAHTNMITEATTFIFVPYYDMPRFTNIPNVINGHLLQYCATLFGHIPLASVSSVVGDLNWEPSEKSPSGIFSWKVELFSPKGQTLTLCADRYFPLRNRTSQSGLCFPVLAFCLFLCLFALLFLPLWLVSPYSHKL